MTRTHPYQRSRYGVRWLAIVALPAALAAGCGDGGDDPRSAPTPARTATPAPTRTLTPTPIPTATPTMVNTSASAACDKLAGCDQCFINQTGQCISTSGCAERLSADVAVCINGVSGCDPATLGDCLFPGCDGNDPTGQCQ